jgi:hypothetical protein
VTDWMVARARPAQVARDDRHERDAELRRQPRRQLQGAARSTRDTNLAAPWQSGMTGIGSTRTRPATRSPRRVLRTASRAS